ncbi:hypothetical protein [Bradyrhizobium sp.]|uniref:hypothetical protein n=1 Tax=Bradyrhizobium sp. TaxID=376 RepID=UPI0025C378C0|nr:hypothetical protein [Bradyrhizobium sp.]
MASVRLSRGAGELFLRLIDHNPPVVLQMTLDEFSVKAGRELVAAGALVADGFARSITSFEDETPRNVDLIWLDNESAYGYFSPTDGFVIPDQKSIQLYRADFGWWLRWLTAALDLVNAGRPFIVVPDACWVVGDICVTSRIKVPLVFARGLGSNSIAIEVGRSLKQRGAVDGGVLLTSSRHVSPIDGADCFELKSVYSLLNSDGKDFAIDRTQLVARWTGYRVPKPVDAVNLSPDGRVLNLKGQVLHLRGPVHRSIIKKLVESYVGGKPARTQDVLSEAAPTVDTIAKAFRNSPHWLVLKPLIRTKKGLSWFEL